MSECRDLEQSIEDDRRIYHAIDIELSKIPDLRDTSLVELEVIVLKAKRDVLQQVVNYADGEVLMVSIQCPQYDGQEVDVAVFDVMRLDKHLVQDMYDLYVSAKSRAGPA